MGGKIAHGKVEGLAEAGKLKKAVSLVKTTARDAAIKRIHGRYFEGVLSEAHFRNILKHPSKVLNASSDIKSAFLDFAKDKSAVDVNSRQAMYEVIKTKIEAGNQDHLDAYVGHYRCFRLSDESDSLVQGVVEIVKYEDGGFGFEHKSIQNLRILGQTELNHDGPVYIRSNRVYLIGLGKDRFGSYVRPIILGAVDNPKERYLIGMLLTETERHVPMACKTVFVHFDLFERASAQDDDEGYVESIKGFLKNESDLNDVLYGWGEE